MSAELNVHLILDNYGTHKTELIRNWLAERPRFYLHFTPTSASWLNLVKCWSTILTEKQLRRSGHRSTRELEQAIRSYIDRNNQACDLTQNRRPNPLSRSPLLCMDF